MSFKASPGDGLVVDDGRGVVAGVGPVHGAPDDGLPEVALLVAAADALVYGGPDLTARDADLAPKLDEEDRVARVLAEGYAAFTGYISVLEQPLEDLVA